MKKKNIIIIAAVALVLLLVLGYFLFFSGSKEVTITFDANGGTSVSSMKIKKGEKIKLPTTTKENYKFDGWYRNGVVVDDEEVYNEDTTLKAFWSEATTKKYKITFDSKGGTEMKEIEATCDAKVTFDEEPTKDGYEFEYWEDEKGNEFYGENYSEECSDIKLTAKWKKKEEEKKEFTVKFDSKGGSKVDSITIECGKSIKLPANPTRDGYTFVSWTNSKAKKVSNGDKLACEDITLNANWKQDTKTTTPTITPTAKPTNTPEPTNTPTPKPTNTPTPTPTNQSEPKYTCTEGTLSGDKCIIEGTVRETCPEGTKVDGNLCIKTSDSNGGTRQCKSYTVSINGKGSTWTGKGSYYMVGNSYGKCAYYKWDDYKTKEQCDAANDTYHKTTWVSELTGCFAETYITFPSGESSYETVCASDYQYYSSDQLSSKFGIHDNAKCLKKVSKTKYCDENFTLSNGKCTKTVNATLK